MGFDERYARGAWLMRTILRTTMTVFLLALGACGKTTGVKVGKKPISPGGAQKASVAAVDTMKRMADRLEASDLAQKSPNEIAQLLSLAMSETLKLEKAREEAKSIAGRIVGLNIVLQGSNLKLSLNSARGQQTPWMEAAGTVSGGLERVGSLSGYPDENELSVQSVARANEKDAKTSAQRPGKRTQGELYAKCLNQCRQTLLFISRGNWVIPLVHIQYNEKNTEKGARLKIVAGLLDAIKKQASGREAALKDPAAFELKFSLVPAGQSRVMFEARPKTAGTPVMVSPVDVSIDQDGPANLCLGGETAPDCPAN